MCHSGPAGLFYFKSSIYNIWALLKKDYRLGHEGNSLLVEVVLM